MCSAVQWDVVMCSGMCSEEQWSAVQCSVQWHCTAVQWSVQWSAVQFSGICSAVICAVECSEVDPAVTRQYFNTDIRHWHEISNLSQIDIKSQQRHQTLHCHPGGRWLEADLQLSVNAMEWKKQSHKRHNAVKNLDPCLQTTLVKNKYLEVLWGKYGAYQSKFTLKPLLIQNMVHLT